MANDFSSGVAEDYYRQRGASTVTSDLELTVVASVKYLQFEYTVAKADVTGWNKGDRDGLIGELRIRSNEIL